MKKLTASALCVSVLLSTHALASPKPQIPTEEKWRAAETLCNSADNCSALETVVLQLLDSTSDPDDIKSVLWKICLDPEAQDPDACEAGMYVYGRLYEQAKSNRAKLFATDMVAHMETIKVLWQHAG